MKSNVISLIILIILIISSCSNETSVIYDEADVPKYKLPEILVSNSGDSILTAVEWMGIRREELLKLFTEEEYGKYPTIEYKIDFIENILAENYINGKAVVKEIEALVTTSNGTGKFTILYIYPKAKKNVPVFAGLNFKGNHTIDTLQAISVTPIWVENDPDLNIRDNHASPENRGVRASRWPLQTIIDHGYAVATVYYGDFDPDYDDGFKNGFHPVFADEGIKDKKYAPGSISIWAKGMSLIVDYLQQDSIADPERIIAIGHSRLGKAALWSAANDERFSAVISNNSGCGGAALSMRCYGERVGRINTVFPHWFCDEFNRYNGRENKLPMDQHMLLALMAPRPLYVASATEDQWADPLGEFLSLQKASQVYDLFGYNQDFPTVFPEPDHPYQGITAYHIRSGIHDLTEYDWIMYLNWCDSWLVK